MKPMFEYLKVKSSLHWFSYKHFAFLDIQRLHSPFGHRRYGRRRESTTQREDSEERSSQGELLLYSPQGLGTLHQLLLLI